ncbi:tRNA dihydrouridine synthase [Podospora bellae-mahoneyi]|uniref:tRNA dihydrouridine synthase n=1 Tax=Podospora bellae-mahoneyi TaxID=2093777 RepID=A0ABR0FWK4_9PEZI|nr:tRNA dihydrouridine synthase [Podospora bellae-mahoneyi]
MANPLNQEFIHPLKLFEVAKNEKRLLHTSAPMLAFRQTAHHYGTDLCWTPMILAKEFNRNKFARDSDFTISTAGPQPPTIVQFGANVPQELARASSLVVPFASGVDLNCGCPQSWACSSTLGAALMEKRELVRDIVLETRSQLHQDGWDVSGLEKDINSPKGRSVSIKIRVHKDLRKTIDFITTLLAPCSLTTTRPIDFLTIHPRTRQTPSSTPINVESLSILTSTFGTQVPILLSGDVFTLDSLPFTSPFHNTLSSSSSPPEHNIPHLSGLMSARALLANPALFSGRNSCPWEAVEYFLNKTIKAPMPFKLVLHHINEMCSPGMGPSQKDKVALLNKQERAELMKVGDMVELIDFLEEKKPGGIGRM